MEKKEQIIPKFKGPERMQEECWSIPGIFLCLPPPVTMQEYLGPAGKAKQMGLNATIAHTAFAKSQGPERQIG